MKSYVPNTQSERQAMLEAIGLKDMYDLFVDVPSDMLLKALDLPEGKSETEIRRLFSSLAADTEQSIPIFRGAGAYHHYIPAAVPQLVARSEFYTAYTPYQTEMSQGMLQAIFEYQTMLCDLTGMAASNASVYDGAHACAEVMLAMRASKRKARVLYSSLLHPEYIETMKTYARFAGVELEAVPATAEGVTDYRAIAGLADGAAGVLVASPNFLGNIEDMQAASDAAHAAGLLFGAVVNPISLGVLKKPGDYGADFALGEGQPLGMPLNFGGPYLGFVAAAAKLMRSLTGRIVGETTDDEGNRVYCLTLSAREQHIRREKAASNICSNQCLCAVTAAMYLSVMGPNGLAEVAEQCAQKAHYLADAIAALPGVRLRYPSAPFFHEFVVEFDEKAERVDKALLKAGYMSGLPLSRFDKSDAHGMLWCATELNTREELDGVVAALKEVLK